MITGRCLCGRCSSRSTASSARPSTATARSAAARAARRSRRTRRCARDICASRRGRTRSANTNRRRESSAPSARAAARLSIAAWPRIPRPTGSGWEVSTAIPGAGRWRTSGWDRRRPGTRSPTRSSSSKATSRRGRGLVTAARPAPRAPGRLGARSTPSTSRRSAGPARRSWCARCGAKRTPTSRWSPSAPGAWSARSPSAPSRSRAAARRRSDSGRSPWSPAFSEPASARRWCARGSIAARRSRRSWSCSGMPRTIRASASGPRSSTGFATGARASIRRSSRSS